MDVDNRKIVIEKTELSHLRDKRQLVELLEQPKVKIAEFLTGALASGRQDAILIGGRLVQSAIAGNFMKQLGKEISDLMEKGRIKENYAETKYGFKSLADILRFIDSEAPDEDRFIAVKNLFFALNSVDTKESEEILMYKLFQLGMELSATQLLLLRISFNYLKKHQKFPESAQEWLRTMAHEQGHHLEALIKQDEVVLIDKGLLTDRRYPDRSGIQPANARLTDLGEKLCEHLSDYSDIKKDWVC